MAFKRADLIALGIEPEKIETLIGWHSETVNALQATIDEKVVEADKLTKVQAELDKAKKDLAKANETIKSANEADYKGKYEALTTEYEQFKADTTAKEKAAARRTALSEQLKTAGYSDSATRLILRNGFADSVELDESGKAVNLDTVVKSIQADADFASFTPKVEDTSHNPATPPANNGASAFESMSLSDKMKYANDNPNAAEVRNWLGK